MKKKYLLPITTVLSTLFSVNVNAMAKGPVGDSSGSNSEVIDSNRNNLGASPILGGISTPEGFDVFSEVSQPVGRLVDSRFHSYRELIPQRNAQQGHFTDRCDGNTLDQDSFSDRISYAVELKMHLGQAGLGYVGSAYGMSSNEATYTPNSLISHPLCTVTSSSLGVTLASGKTPSASTIKKANQFANRMNQYRLSALSGNREGYMKASRLWSKLMMCTSYVESLTSANTGTSERVAQRYSPSDYRRPASVLFYEDPYQDAASKLNIGLFQFTPNSGGNIQACIREWNKIYPKCAISPKASQSEMIRTIGSSLQTFNAFCGVSKVTETFAVQVNSSRSNNTHPSNGVNGKLKGPNDRCVSLHFAAGKAYNHFGPFQNTTGSNLDEVLSCTLAGEY